MPARRFQTTRKRTAPADASEAGRSAPAMPRASGISVAWLLDRMGFDSESFWQDPDSVRYLDAEVAVETVAAAHADASFPMFLDAWDDRNDHENDGKSFTGRLIAASMTHVADWPMGRSWFHDLFMDLARLDGALGIDLSSEGHLRHGVTCYWRRVGILSASHAAASKPAPAPATTPRPEWLKDPVPAAPMRQLALF